MVSLLDRRLVDLLVKIPTAGARAAVLPFLRVFLAIAAIRRQVLHGLLLLLTVLYLVSLTLIFPHFIQC